MKAPEWAVDDYGLKPGAMIGGICAAIVLLIALIIYFASKQHEGEHCVATERQYVAPTYVQSGNVMIPVGGGMQDVCVRWEPDQ